MTSTSTSNHQNHPPTTSAGEISTSQPAHSSSNIDPNANLPTSGYAPNENQLAGLVEAATAAAGQDVSEWAAAAAVAAAAGNQHHLDSYGPEIHIDEDGFGDANFGTGLGGGSRQLRSAASDQGQSSGLSRTVSKKRKRGDDPLDPALAASSAGVGFNGGHQHQQGHQHSHGQHYDGEGLEIRPVPAQSLSDARSVGLHSAAALFRQPSSNKKHTRPPMSKMFMSLELSPENFLQLQAAAKSYMLDDNHPERRDAVGQRGKGDTEMVKLRLWNCVRQFLEVEGHGERFFGEHVVNEGMGPREYVWPRDQHKIIALVIPLLRRMVTNERQRQYAIETRKGTGPDDRRRRRTTDEGLPTAPSASPPRYSTEEQLQMHAQQQQHQHQHPTIPEEYTPAQAQTAPSMSTPQPQMGPSNGSNVQLGLTDLLLDGYTTDWDAVARSYDMYNHDYELDNLMNLSGLQNPDWRGLVAAVDSHYQVFHHGAYDCPKPCEDENINRILEAEALANLHWRVGGNRYPPARNEFASGITRDVSRIIRDSLAAKNGVHPPTYDHYSQNGSTPFPGGPNTTNSTNSSAPTSQSPMLRISILQNGKRILPRFDLSAEQCPDLANLRHGIARRFGDQFPGLFSEHRSESSWKVKVFVPDGLTPVNSDGEWTIALLSAATVDWMDSDLKVLVELESTDSGVHYLPAIKQSND